MMQKYSPWYWVKIFRLLEFEKDSFNRKLLTSPVVEFKNETSLLAILLLLFAIQEDVRYPLRNMGRSIVAQASETAMTA